VSERGALRHCITITGQFATNRLFCPRQSLEESGHNNHLHHRSTAAQSSAIKRTNEGSAGPIPGLVNSHRFRDSGTRGFRDSWLPIGSFSVIYRRARRLNSKVKESIPIPNTIPWKKMQKHAKKVLKNHPNQPKQTAKSSNIVLTIPGA
jgi:hypothetical protein